MSQSDEEKEYRLQKMLEKYKRHIFASRGIFHSKTRKRLLGQLKLSGRYRTKTAFWSEQEQKVKSALVDLQLFIETAEELHNENIEKVLNLETLKPIVEALLLNPVNRNAEPDYSRGEIANLFVQNGFWYLQCMGKKLINESSIHTINLACDLSHFLADSFRSDSEKTYLSSLDRPSK